MEPSDPSKPTVVPKTTDYNTRVCLLYDFRAGMSAADSVRKIHAIFGADAVGLEGAKTWWKKFRAGNTKIADERPADSLEDILARAAASVLAALPSKVAAPVEDEETTEEPSETEPSEAETTEETTEQWEDEEEEESELDDSDKENVNDDDEEEATCIEDDW
ncbi:Histone-lysine N-methyltransferase SETMAR [Aphelenchoides fujianensis]|nr:Histone-lysine N-methyltransferase SETMAR [Aphelenchoides fujianensis]